MKRTVWFDPTSDDARTTHPSARCLMSLFSLDGKVALVTGAGSPGGIGFACAQALHKAGATVAVAATSDRIHERATELGEGSKGFIADLTDAEQVERLVAEVEAAMGPIDLLVNNAGMTSVTDEEAWLSISRDDATSSGGAESCAISIRPFSSRAP